MTVRPLEDPDSGNEPALALARDGHYEQALGWMARALERSPGSDTRAASAQTLGRIARLAEGAGDLENAERAIERALLLQPKYADLHFGHASILLAGHRAVEARRALERALAIHPRYLAARIELALLDAREGRIGEALAALREIQRDSPIAEPRAFMQAMRSMERADFFEAGSYFRRALRGADPHLDRQLERVGALLEEGACDRAAQMLRGTLNHFPGYPDLHALLASAEMRLGHLDDAISSLARALELNPEFHAARVQLARSLDGIGQRAQALDQVSLVLLHDPENALALELCEAWSSRSRQGTGRGKSERKAS